MTEINVRNNVYSRNGIIFFALSFIEGVFLMIGYNHRNYLSYSPIHNAMDILFLGGLIIALCLINYYFDRILCRLIIVSDDKTSALSKTAIPRLFVMIAIALFGLWLPYYILMWPGGAWYDTGNQICQFMGAETLTKANPILQTILSGGSFYLGVMVNNPELGIAGYIFMQMITSSMIISYSIISLYKVGRSKWIVYLLVTMYGIIPVLPLYVVVIGKDTNFGMQILLATTCLFNVYTDRKMKKKEALLFLISLVLMSLLRNSGVLLTAIFAVIMIYINRCELKKSILVAIIAFCIVVSFQSLTTIILHIDPKANETENLSVPLLQMGGYILEYYDEIPEEDLTVIDRVMNINSIQQKYDIDISDSLKWAYIERNPNREDLEVFYSLYFKYIKTHPLFFFKILIAKSYGYFDPMTGQINRPFTVVGLSPISDYIYETLGINVSNSFDLKFMNSFVYKLISFKGIRVLTHCGFYMWLLLFSIAMGGRYRVNKVFFLPMCAFAAGLVASPVNAYFRYNFPIVLVAPFLICVVYSFLAKKRGTGTSDDYIALGKKVMK